MPIVLQIHYDDGSSEIKTYPAEIWRRDGKHVNKLIISDKTIQRLELDPRRQTADAAESNNHWPPKLIPSRFRLFKESKTKNEMQKAKGESEAENKKDEQDK